jgi:hypothetical protein
MVDGILERHSESSKPQNLPTLCDRNFEIASQKLPPEIFRHLTENRSIFWISPENGPFSGFFSDTKIRTFLEKLFLEIS